MCKMYIVHDIETCYNTIKGVINVPYSEAQKKATAKYMKANLDEIKIRVPKGRKAEIQAHADAMEESTNAFIIRAIDETIQREKGAATNE